MIVMVRRGILAIIGLLALSAAPAAAETGVRQSCSNHATGVPIDRQQVLARGFNLPGWLSGPTSRQPDKAVLAALRRRGLTHIRLPVTAERLMGAFGEQREVVQQFARLDVALETLLSLDFAVSLDLHPAEKLSDLHRVDPDEGFRRIDALWRQLAVRYRSYAKDRLYFEVLNEPSVPVKVWNQQGPHLVETIRAAAPEHTIVYGPADFQQIGALLALPPLRDPNIVYAVHFYEPMVFTHQGLDWSDDPLRYLHGVPYPSRASDPIVQNLLSSLNANGRGKAATLLREQLQSPWTDERIDRAIARAGDWSRWHGKPVIINEFGVLSWKANPSDRAAWIKAVRKSAETHCLGWTHWEYADSFGFVRRTGGAEVPDPRLLEALLGSK